MTEYPFSSLGKLLRLERRPVNIIADEKYAEIGIYCFGKGIFYKEPRSGFEVGDKKLFLIKEGDFILQVTFAWEGAVGLASKREDGMYGSTRFPTFRVNENLCYAPFLVNYFKTQEGRNQLIKISPGSAGRNRVLSLKRILEVQVPLPSLDEQRRIVARIEELATRIEEARELRRKAIEEVKYLSYAVSLKLFGVPNRIVDDVADVTKLAGFEYTKYFTNALPGKVKVIRAGNVRNHGLDLSNAMTITEEISDALPRSQLSPGDVVMTFIGAKIGDATYIRSGYPRLHLGPNVAKLTPRSQISHLYLVKVLQSPILYHQIEEITKSTAQPSLSMKTIRTLELPVPASNEQHRIVTYLDALQSKIDALKRHQAETAAELDALMPSILDRAFRGEL